MDGYGEPPAGFREEKGGFKHVQTKQETRKESEKGKQERWSCIVLR